MQFVLWMCCNTDAQEQIRLLSSVIAKLEQTSSPQADLSTVGSSALAQALALRTQATLAVLVDHQPQQPSSSSSSSSSVDKDEARSRITSDLVRAISLAVGPSHEFTATATHHDTAGSTSISGSTMALAFRVWIDTLTHTTRRKWNNGDNHMDASNKGPQHVIARQQEQEQRQGELEGQIEYGLLQWSNTHVHPTSFRQKLLGQLQDALSQQEG